MHRFHIFKQSGVDMAPNRSVTATTLLGSTAWKFGFVFLKGCGGKMSGRERNDMLRDIAEESASTPDLLCEIGQIIEDDFIKNATVTISFLNITNDTWKEHTFTYIEDTGFCDSNNVQVDGKETVLVPPFIPVM